MTGHLTENSLSEAGVRYLPSDRLCLAVRVAQATERPLLLYGDPGSGKSSLARYIAARRGYRYYEHVTTARTQARDLLWSFDSVRRLGDAQARGGQDGLPPDSDYVVPGVFWWAFDRTSALEAKRAKEPVEEWNERHRDRPAVLLIDEIDKADPDLPNGLLSPLADRRFTVSDVTGGLEVTENRAARTLIFVTSNRERDLPPAFERRCVVHCLPGHDEADLRRIADRHLDRDGLERAPEELISLLLDRLTAAKAAAGAKHRRAPSTAEFLDAVRACVRLPDDVRDDFTGLIGMIFDKDPDRPAGNTR
ncbi:AAA family ATPase [Amycolatopsis azurea]|uniref:AAA family ATPase n=1 Tax=Amycolatopsis azurea TaxID=36819 RepID=UPI0038064CB7